MLTVDLILHDRLEAEEEERKRREREAAVRAEGAMSNFLTLVSPERIQAEIAHARDEIGLLSLQKGYEDIQAAGIPMSADTYREYLYEYGDPGHLSGTLRTAQQQGILADPTFAQRTADRFSALASIANHARNTTEPLPKEDYWNLIAAAEQPKPAPPLAPTVPRPMTVEEEQAVVGGRAATVNPLAPIQPAEPTIDLTLQNRLQQMSREYPGAIPEVAPSPLHPTGQGPEAAFRQTFEVLPPGASPAVLEEHKAVIPRMVELPPGFKPAEIIVGATILGGIAPTLGLWMAGLSAASAVPKVGKGVTKVLEVGTDPMTNNLVRLGVPEKLARPIATIVTGAAIGKAPVGQTNWLGGALTAIRGGDTAELARAVTAIRKGILTPEIEAQAFSEGRTKDWLGLGARVKAADRDNLGTVVSYDAESNTARVHFYNQKTGTQATVSLDAKLLSPAGKARTGAAAREETRAMENAVNAAKAEQAGPLVNKMYRTLESADYLTQREARAAAIAAQRHGAAGAQEAILARSTPETFVSSLRQAQAMRAGEFPAGIKLTEPWTPQEIHEFGNGVVTSPLLRPFEKTRGGETVLKLLEGKQILMPSEAELLGKVYPELRPVLANVTKPRPISLFRQIVDLVNIPRAIQASYDLSFPLRQGGLLIGRKEFWGAFNEIATVAPKWGTELTNTQLLEWAESPYWARVKAAGLNIGDPGTGIVQERGLDMPLVEEAYISRGEPSWANKIAGHIPGVPESQRVYTMMGNKMRWDYFVGKVKEWDALGIGNPQAEKALAQWINIATGWGQLGSLEKALPELSAILFAPRFLAARLEAIPYGIYLAVKNPIVARSIAYDLASFVASQASLLALMKYGIDGNGVPGVEVELDPRSTDVGRIRIGATRIDTLAGFQPIFRTIGQVITGQGKSAITGEVYPMSRAKILSRYGQSKFAPGVGFGSQLLSGQTYVGEPLEATPGGVKTITWNTLFPFLVRDLTEAVKMNSPGVAALTGVLGLFGATTLTYETPWQKLEDQRGKASQTIYKMSLSDLRGKYGTRAANDMVAGDPGVIAADQAVEERKAWYGTTNRSLKSGLLGFTKEQVAADKTIADPGQWREDRKTRQANKAGFVAGFYFANPEQRDRMVKERAVVGDPFQIPKNATPDDIVARYLAIYTDHTNVETGMRDETLYQDLDRFQAMLTPQQASWLDTNLGLKATPREKKYLAGVKQVEDYFDIAERVYQENRADLHLSASTYDDYLKQVQEVATQQAIKDGHSPEDAAAYAMTKPALMAVAPEYSYLQGQIDLARKQWRLDNPTKAQLLITLGLETPSAADYWQYQGSEPTLPAFGAETPPLTLPNLERLRSGQ